MSALHGADVKVTVVEADVDEGCLDNTLTILDDTPHNSNSSLKYPGLSAQCGQSSLPRSGDSVISTGVVSIKFHSQSNNHGTVMFKIILEATAPEFCPSNAVDDACPDGPCCEGPDCCVIHAGTIPKGEVERITFIVQKIELFQRSAPLTTLYNLMLDNLAPTN